jgi:osmotically-inducible protein OsmY
MTRTDSPKMLAHQIETALHLRVGRHVHDLDVIVRAEGVILRGQASTYYAKQLAQHIADRVSGLPVVANEIAVV